MSHNDDLSRPVDQRPISYCAVLRNIAVYAIVAVRSDGIIGNTARLELPVSRAVDF